ncbi:hypothetical protein [Soonwooa purpurea]
MSINPNDWGNNDQFEEGGYDSGYSGPDYAPVGAVVDNRLKGTSANRNIDIDVFGKDGTVNNIDPATMMAIANTVVNVAKNFFGDIGCWGGQAYDEQSIRDRGQHLENYVDEIKSNYYDLEAVKRAIFWSSGMLAMDKEAREVHLVNKCSKEACDACIKMFEQFLLTLSKYYKVTETEYIKANDFIYSHKHDVYFHAPKTVIMIQEPLEGDIIVVNPGGGTGTGGTNGGTNNPTDGGTNGGTNGGSNSSNGLRWFDTECGQIQAYSQAQAYNFCRVQQNNGGTNSLVDWQVNAGSTTKDNTMLYLGGALAGLLIYFNSQPKKRK